MQSDILAVKSLLALGEKPKDIAERTGVAYQKVLSIRKKMEAESDNALVGEAAAISPEVVHTIVEKAREEAPAAVVKKLEMVQEGITSLQKLDGDFHQTISKALTKAEELLDSEKLKASEWVSITNALSNAYNNIFNNSGVNVHVDNSTKVSASSVNMMKGALRG